MILPTKYLPPERSIVVIGATVLALLDRPRPVSWVWDRLSGNAKESPAYTYDWFILALDFLHSVGAVELEHGELRTR